MDTKFDIEKRIYTIQSDLNSIYNRIELMHDNISKKISDMDISNRNIQNLILCGLTGFCFGYIIKIMGNPGSP